MTTSVFSKSYDRLRMLLIAARRKAGLTQAEVAERLGRPQSYVSKYEQGERRIDVIELLKITDAVEIDPRDLISDLQRITRRERRK